MNETNKNIDLSSPIFAAYICSPLIFAVPVIRDLEFILGTYYITVLNFLFLFILLLTQTSKVRLHNVHLGSLLLILYVFAAFVLGGSYTINHLRPLLFFLNVLITIVVCTNITPPAKPRALIMGSFALATFVSLVYLLPPFQQFSMDWEGRFLGFSFSATTYSTYYIFLGILALGSLHTRKQKIAVLVILLVIIFLTQTRTSLFFVLIISAAELMPAKRSFRMSAKRYILLVALTMSVYMLVDYAQLIFSLFINRYEGQKDYSSLTRLALLKKSLDIFTTTDPLHKLIGHGPEYLRFKIKEMIGTDLKSHFDFIMFVVDYGIVFFIGLLAYFKRFFTETKEITLMLFAYYISFYHNMAYDSILLTVLIASRTLLLSLKYSTPFVRIAPGI